MHQYLDLLRRIYVEGTPKHPTRTESGNTKNSTVGLANLHFSHDLAEGFPLLTTRKLDWRALVGELRSFLEGRDNNEAFVANGCKFWTPWAKSDGSLGPVYGVQWNRHGQLEHVLKSLRSGGTDRRMVVSAWRPDEHKDMVLPPCHLLWVVTPYDGKLNLSWIQRSCDFPLGVPYNIASYALLAHILAEWAGMAVGTVDCIFCDAHIYANQLDGVRKQLQRDPGKLSKLYVRFADSDNFLSWMCELADWEPQPNIDFGEPEV